MENLLWVILAHYLADYPLQGDFLTQTKDKHFSSLLAHSIIYGLILSLCFKFLGIFALWKVPILIISHMIIDYDKAKNGYKNPKGYLFIGQSLHLLINFILYMN